MKTVAKSIFAAMLLCTAALFCLPSYCEKIDVGELVDQFYKATEVQREEIKKLYEGENVTASGVIKNVEDSRFFNTEEKLQKNYYTVKTDVQDAPNGNPYQVIFFYENAEAVKSLNKGERIEKYGKLLRIVNKGLWVYVWVAVE